MVTLTKENAQLLEGVDTAAEEACLLVGFRGNESFGPILVPVKFIPMPEQGDGIAVDGICHTPAQPTTTGNPGSNQRLTPRLQGPMLDERLTRRELEIVRHIAKGSANKQIALQLDITEQTVKNHIASIMSKLDANNRTHILTLAIRQGLIPLWELGGN